MFFVPFSVERRNHRARRWLRTKEQRTVPGGKAQMFPSQWALEHPAPPFAREGAFEGCPAAGGGRGRGEDPDLPSRRRDESGG